MKKLVMMLVVFALAAPLMAGDVQFAATNNGDGTATITYAVTGGTVRGMALNVDATAALTDVAVDSFFDVFMDAAYMDAENYVLGAGTPIANQDAAGEIGLPSNMFCISMGNLEGIVTADQIVLTGPDCTGTLDINTLRGAIVDTDGVEMTSNLPITFEITSGPGECYEGMPDYSEWEAAGKPDCWCYATQCKGDADGLKEGVSYYSAGYYVGTNDINIMASAWKKDDATLLTIPNGACADFDHQKEGVSYYSAGYRVGTNDINIMAANWKQATIAMDCLPGNLVP